MVKRFLTSANPVLSSVIDAIENSLQCPKYTQVSHTIEVCLPDGVVFQFPANRELTEKGFGFCLTRHYNNSSWDASIIINMKNCAAAGLIQREITAIVLHELGHLLNEPELQEEPTFEYCFINGIEFSRDILEEVRKSNSIAMEVFADSYANKHGYGEELISSFHKQNASFESQIEYCSTRIEKIIRKEYLDGKIMSTHFR